MDNAAIDTERSRLWKTMHKLEQMVHISKSLDKQLEDKANEWTRPSRPRPRRSARPLCSRPASGPPTC